MVEEYYSRPITAHIVADLRHAHPLARPELTAVQTLDLSVCAGRIGLRVDLGLGSLRLSGASRRS